MRLSTQLWILPQSERRERQAPPPLPVPPRQAEGIRPNSAAVTCGGSDDQEPAQSSQ